MRYTRRRWWLHSLCVAILVAAIAATLPAAAGPQQATALGVQQLAPSAPLPALYVALLRPGWNLVGWTAAPTTAPDAAAAIAGSARSFFTFDAGAQSFRSFSPALPDALNSLREIAFGDGVWVFAEEKSVWLQPQTWWARSVPLAVGFNLATWTGPDATPVAVALAAIAPALEVAFTYDASAQL